jgi:gliding motility-associated-like protein
VNRFLWTVTKGACKLEDPVDVNVFDLIIPEGFSPNNDPDGYNNTFEIRGLDLPNQEAEMTIVNGAGTEVFHTTNRNGSEWQEWDGKNSKGTDLPEGTYYYLLKIKSKGNDLVFKKSGFVVLKRY